LTDLKIDKVGDDMNIDVVQHVPFEGLASIEEWGSDNGHTFRMHKLYEYPSIPRIDDLEFLILLGGPMSANDQDQQWIDEERRLISKTISENKPVFGVCLGAQQIAKALGASVIQGDKEVGWHPIRSVSSRLPFIPEELTVFHWHGEQFELPDRAEQLFSSAACQNQGFIYSEKVIGLQFHLEMTPNSIQGLLTHDGDYIDHSQFVQSAEEITDFGIPEQNKTVLFKLLDDLVKNK
jgi:GMP synthase - Glutamine amidotransferase domain